MVGVTSKAARTGLWAVVALGLLSVQACSNEGDADEAQINGVGSTPMSDAAASGTHAEGGAADAAGPQGGAHDAGRAWTSPFEAGAPPPPSSAADASSNGAGHDASAVHDAGFSDAGLDDSGASDDAAAASDRGSKGCGKSSAKLDPKRQLTFQLNGKTRYYLAYLPTNYDSNTPIPMVFVLHGKDMNNYWAANAQDGFKLIEASRDKALLVFPQGSGDVPKAKRQWGDITSGWDVSSHGQDQAFLEALRVYIEDNYCVDTSRRFFTGFSMGGWMTETFACEHADVYRAFAPVAGWGPGGIETGHGTTPYCKSSTRGVPILITQGQSDNIVTPENGEHSRDFWLTRDDCSKTASSMPEFPSCSSYQECAPGLSVHYCTHGGGHGVPADAGAKIWAFFSSIAD